MASSPSTHGSDGSGEWIYIEAEPAMPDWVQSADGDLKLQLEAAMAETVAVEGLLTAQRDKFYGPKKTCAPGKLVFFHGTSWENAQAIEKDGFVPSEVGCLGPGIYVGRCDKALRFARDADRHGGDAGGLVKVRVTIRNPKFVSSDDETWQDEGYDACRADHTTLSRHMEWCINDKAPLEVLGITYVPIDAVTDKHMPLGAESDGLAPLPQSQPLTLESLRGLEKQAGGAAGGDEMYWRRQFHCPQHGLYWARVRCLPNKQVARCRFCDGVAGGHGKGPKYIAIAREEERGRGDFECVVCGKQWSSVRARRLGQTGDLMMMTDIALC